jgi:hypothetical protein
MVVITAPRFSCYEPSRSGSSDRAKARRRDRRSPLRCGPGGLMGLYSYFVWCPGSGIRLDELPFWKICGSSKGIPSEEVKQGHAEDCERHATKAA